MEQRHEDGKDLNSRFRGTRHDAATGKEEKRGGRASRGSVRAVPRERPRYVRPRPALPGAAPAYVSGRSRRGGAGLAEGQGAGRGKGEPRFTQVTDTVSLEMRFISFFFYLAVAGGGGDADAAGSWSPAGAWRRGRGAGLQQGVLSCQHGVPTGAGGVSIPL